MVAVAGSAKRLCGPPLWVVDPVAMRYAMGRARMPGVWDLSQRCRLSKTVIYETVSGAKARPTASTMCEIASVLGVDVLDLMMERDGDG